MISTTCDLECSKLPSKKNPKVREFVGPVKIILVDASPAEYFKKNCVAACVAMSLVAVGAAVAPVLFYTLSFKSGFYYNLHIFFCTVGFSLSIPSGILALNELSGASAVMKIRDRRIEHALTNIFGIICGAVGFVLIFKELVRLKLTIHGVFGVLAAGFGAVTIVAGSTYWFLDAYVFKIAHVTCGLATFITSALCFILGILKPCIADWLPLPSMAYVLVAFCVYFTAVIAYAPIKKNFFS